MSVDFSHNGFENEFKKVLLSGINLFCGAGFSVEAEDAEGNKLPVGAALLEELKEIFPTIKAYTNLPRACTKLTQTEKRFVKGIFYLRKTLSIFTCMSIYCMLSLSCHTTEYGQETQFAFLPSVKMQALR